MDPIDIKAELDTLTARIATLLNSGPSAGPPPNLEDIPGRYVPRPDFLTGSRLAISSVEYTQAIQFNGSASPGYGPDNGVPLVAYKTMVARAYPLVQRAPLGGDTLTGQRVTGELTLSIGNRVIFRTEPTRSDGARIGATAHIDRGSWDREFSIPGGSSNGGVFIERLMPVNCPLNFMIPAFYCKPGRIHATVRLWPLAEGPTSSLAKSSSQYLEFLNIRAPKVCLVRVSWRNSMGAVTRPTDAEMLGTVATAGRMLPFPYFESMILGVEETRGDDFAKLADTAGGCNFAWSSLNSRLNVTRIFTSLFGLGQIVYGMVSTAAIPAGGGKYNAGCGSEGQAGSGFSGQALTFAHEIGHLYGRSHVAVSGDASNDTMYPKYGGSSRSIGEVGIDTGTSPSALFEAWNSDDIMSYGNNQWISPYTYQNILAQHDKFDTAAVDTARLRRLLILDFRVHRAVRGVSRVELRRSTLVEAPGPLPFRSTDLVSPISLDMLDGNSQILATHHCSWSPMHGSGHCGCGSRHGVPLEREPWLDFQEVMEWPAGTARIAFHRGEEPFHIIEAGEPPIVWIDGPIREEEFISVRVRAEHPREQVSIVILFSADAGVTWQPVAFDPPDGELKLPVDSLTGGDQCVFRAIGTAELQSATADTEQFQLPRNRRRLYLNLPTDCCPIVPGPVTLSAVVDTRGLGAIAPAEIRWSSNLDGELGFGYTLTADLREGEHELTASAPDGNGSTLAERGIIIVGGRPR